MNFNIVNLNPVSLEPISADLHQVGISNDVRADAQPVFKATDDPWDVYCRMSDEQIRERSERLLGIAATYGAGGP